MPLDTAAIASLLDQAARLLDQAKSALISLPSSQPPTSTAISTSSALDVALSHAASGSTLLLAPELVYPAPLVLRQSVMLLSSVVPDGRMSADAPCPRFLMGIAVPSDGVGLIGLDVAHADRTQTLVPITGDGSLIDRCRVRGNITLGQKRGISPNGKGWTITRNYVDRCFGPYPGDDCQAVCWWSTPGPGLLEDNYLSGSTETVMSGGADPADEAHVPADFIIRKNRITKDPTWQSRAVGVKNTLEIKNGRRFLIEDNDIEYSWGGHGQDGYLLMLTVRNQGGHAPYSTIEDGTIRNNRFAHGGAAVNILASDNINPSGRMARVTIDSNVFADVDVAKYSGSPKLVQIQRGPLSLRVTNNDLSRASGHTSAIYFDGQPKLDDFNLHGNKWPVPPPKYGVFGTGAAVGKAFDMYVNTGTYQFP